MANNLERVRRAFGLGQRIGKSLVSAARQSIRGWPFETADDTFGISWGGTEAGNDAFMQARADVGMALDEITLSKPTRVEQTCYKLAAGAAGPRATSKGRLREHGHVNVLALSTGEKSVVGFCGRHLQEGARKRMADIPALSITQQQPPRALAPMAEVRIFVNSRVRE